MEHLKLLNTVAKIKLDYFMLHRVPKWLIMEKEETNLLTRSKATNVDLITRYGEWFGLDYVIVYFYNVYGGREVTNG